MQIPTFPMVRAVIVNDIFAPIRPVQYNIFIHVRCTIYLSKNKTIDRFSINFVLWDGEQEFEFGFIVILRRSRRI